jgi:hypothetical protein
VVPGFDAKLADDRPEDEVYEFLVNEKFSNTEASTVVGAKPIANTKVAARYAAAVRGALEKGFAEAALATYKAGPLAARVDDLEKALVDALIQLYDALDEQLATIARAKQSGVPGAVPNPQSGILPQIRPAPLDITGNPVPAP